MRKKTASLAGMDRLVGQKIRWFRVQAGLSQQDLAERIGISYQQLHKYESGQNSVSAVRLAQIAEILGTNISQLVGSISPEHLQAEMNDMMGEYQQLVRNYSKIVVARHRSAIQELVRALAEEQK